jgi:hypothetical protein
LVALIFEHLYWISRSRIGRCSRDEAIKYRNELKAMEPHRHTVAEVENHARKWWQQRGLRTLMGAGMNKTPIRWSTYTWNCWSGCERISPACRFCFAETKAERMRSTPAFPNGFELTYRPHKLRDPKAPAKRIYVDLTEEIIMNPGALPKELLGWRRYRIEYGGHAERCVLETPIYLPPSVNADRLRRLLNS